MEAILGKTTITEIIQEEAVKHNQKIPSAADIEYITWEHTGYPGFWNIGRDGDTIEECFRTQVRQFFDEIK